MTEDGEYKLIEYGAGPHSVYAKSTLYKALNDAGIDLAQSSWSITPVYSGPALAEWAISSPGSNTAIRFLDPLTGQLLPDNESSFNRQATGYTPPSSAAGSAHTRPEGNSPQEGAGIPNPDRLVHTSESFDPYDNILWMVNTALTIKSDSFENILKQYKQIVFVSSGSDRTYSVPLPVFRYQKWSLQNESALYIMSGSKSSPTFISLQALTDSGHFVQYQ